MRPRQFHQAEIDDLVQRYESGQTATELARYARASLRMIRKVLLEAGVLRSRQESHALGVQKVRVEVPVEVTDAYADGMGFAEIAEHWGLSYIPVHRALLERGVTVRPRSADAAHASNIGRPKSIESKIKSAATRERRQLGTSGHEDTLAGLLTARAIAFRRQRAIGPYNVDFALDAVPVAVEVVGGGYKSGRAPQLAERLEYLLDSGWSVLDIRCMCYIEGANVQVAPTDIAADYVVALAEQLRLHPPARGEHRVIRSDGKPIASRRSKTHRGA